MIPVGLEPDSLTPREREVARHAVLGRGTDEVAARLSISEHTVRTHLRNIFRKLGIRRRGELTGYVLRVGII
jgi:DNA-binding CsgD family transcriptional regulator